MIAVWNEEHGWWEGGIPKGADLLCEIKALGVSLTEDQEAAIIRMVDEMCLEHFSMGRDYG